MVRVRHVAWVATVLGALILSACGASVRTPAPSKPAGDSPTEIRRSSTTTPPLVMPTLQATATPVTYGPDQVNFPIDINPLTGQGVLDPSLLKIPALLISVSNFPVTARPQAGLSFARFVFEFSITGDETRFLAAFYGQFPEPEIPLHGDCATRDGAFKQTGILLGGRAWFDANRNGIQDPGEEGVGGICLSLIDASGYFTQRTATDSNGYYGFNVKAPGAYTVDFAKPAYLDFSKPDASNENNDSDVDALTGETPVVHEQGDDVSWDAGLFPNPTYVAPTPDPTHDPQAQVGPVRSGRLLYTYIQRFFQDSCLIYAYASPEVLAKLPHCSFVAHEDAGGGSMLAIDRMKAIADDNMRHNADGSFNYASNLFSDSVPTGGYAASQINVFFANLDQSGWSYDPLYRAYLRFVDMADKAAPGVLHADVDRLTGRQIHFENIVVVMADTDVVSPTNLDIHLDEGNTGNAYLFRDGQEFSIQWSTRAGAYEKKTGLRRPIQFLNTDGSPAALKPGHTWVVIVTPFSQVTSQGSGVFLVKYAPPEGEAQ